MENLEIYNKVRSVPAEAQRKITGGRLNGKTDINPMWRIKSLTETFGPAGIGWYYEVVEKRLEHGADGEISAFVQINLFVKDGYVWSQPIVGLGGSSFVSKEKSGLYTSDECFKMALTDAISVSCKALGMGADIYWEKDRTKYDQSAQTAQTAQSDEVTQQEKEKKTPIFMRSDEDLVNRLLDKLHGTNLCGKNKKGEKWKLAQFETSLKGFTHDDYNWLLNLKSYGYGNADNNGQ